MKEKRKGFTLIELLAVIVILAIIALIATPIVLNIIKTSRKGAFTRSAEGVLQASKLYYISSLVEEIIPNKITFTCNNKECLSNDGTKLDVDGNMGTGDVTIKDNGNIFFTLTNGKYCAVKYEESSNIVLKDGNCSNVDLTNDTTPPIIRNVTVNTTTNSITIVVSAEDMESGIHHYEYSIDGGATYEEGTTNTKTFKNLEKKDYEAKVRVYNKTYGKDNYSDKTGMAEYKVNDLVQLKDIDLPEIKVTPKEWSTSKTIEIDYKGALVQEYSLDGGTTYIKYEGPFTITENMTIVAKASDGTNSIKSSTQITKIDNVKPTISVKAIKKTTNTVVNSDTWSDEILVYTFANATEGASGSTIYYCKDTNNTCNPNIQKESIDITDTGIYYIRYKAISGSGVESDINSYKAKVDTIAPTVSYSLKNGTYNESKTITITAKDDNFKNLSVHVWQGNVEDYQYFSANQSSNESTNNTFNVTLGEGTWTIYAYATDMAGNVQENLPQSQYGWYYQTYNIKIKDILPNKTYTTGEAIKLGGYKWHVIGDTGTQVTLLMDANQLGDNSNMGHCTSANNSSNNCTYNGSYYVYSWDKSLIRTYLNGEFLTYLESKIGNEIVSTSICADPAKNTTGGLEQSYGGYLMSELNALGKTEACTNQVSDKVRLISPSEYYNMTPYYTSTDSNYPNVENITKISNDGDYASWLYCSSSNCGNAGGDWWIMGSYSYYLANSVKDARYVSSSGYLNGYNGEIANGVRPVITIVK